jgi:predicted acetyltransferase
MKIDKKIVSFANILNVVVDRIFTIPKYRNRGYATTMLRILKAISVLSGEYSMISPVDQHVAHIYEKAGWVNYNEIINKDGSIDMVSNKALISDYMDLRKWKGFLEEMC